MGGGRFQCALWSSQRGRAWPSSGLVVFSRYPAVPAYLGRLLMYMALAAVPSAVQAVEPVRAVGVARVEDRTRIVFESKSRVRFVLFSLRNPERALLDLEGVELSAALAGLQEKVGADHPYIKSVRVGQSAPDQPRVEFDFGIEVEPRIFVLEPVAGYGYRIVLDLYPSRPIDATRAGARYVAQSDEPAATGEEMLLEVRINRQEPGETAPLVRRSDGRLLVRREDLEKWRLRVPNVPPALHGGNSYFPLDALRGLSYQLDESSQSLDINAAPGLFAATEIKGRPLGFIHPTPPSPGAFFNYDVFADQAKNQRSAGALFETGIFGRWGAGTSTFVHRDLGGNAPLIRLDTTWSSDRPASLSSLRLGDAISRAGSWGRSVRFGGIQWATNFATQPEFNPFPLPGLAGEAVMPSTVDLYVNEVLRMRREVPAGPFSIQDLPVVTGQGEARLVVRDILGRERMIVQPYYASPRLLQQGLHDVSYEMGLARENYGLASNDYGRFIASGTHRVGINDRFTGEVHGELLRGQQTAGLGGAMLVPGGGLLSASVAASHSDRGTGKLVGLGFERQGRWLSFGSNTQVATESFAQLGLQTGEIAPRQLSQAFLSIGTGGYGSLGLSYTHQDRRNQQKVRLVSMNYSASLGYAGFLGLSLIHSLGQNSRPTIGLVLTRPIDDRTSASASLGRQATSTTAELQVQRSLPPGSGFGYRLRAGAGDSDLREAALAAQSRIGTYSLEARQLGGQAGVRAAASGGAVLLGGGAFLSRRIADSFAVVEVPDYRDVRIYVDNHEVARTDGNGRALLPRLRAYEKNGIRVEQADLPLDAQIDDLQIEAAPYFRSGLALRFPVKRSNGALLTVTLNNGDVLPAGAVIRINGGNEQFPVGERGEAYLTGLTASNRLHVTWRGQNCELNVSFPKTADPLPHLGTYQCTEMKP